MEKPLRENPVPKEGWKDWVRAMIPYHDHPAENKWYEPRNQYNGAGHMCKNVRKVFDKYDCGKLNQLSFIIS